MKPIDLPPDNIIDALRADLCRPPVARENKTYIAKPDDYAGHEQHDDRLESEPLPPAESLPPGQFLMDQPRYQRPRVDGSIFFGVPLPLRQSTSERPPVRFITG